METIKAKIKELLLLSAKEIERKDYFNKLTKLKLLKENFVISETNNYF